MARLSRSRIVTRSAKKENVITRNYIKETCVAFQTQYGLSIHLLLVMALHFWGAGPQGLINADPHQRPGGATGSDSHGERAATSAHKKLHKEEWLPVVNESGDVTGKVAKSITRS